MNSAFLPPAAQPEVVRLGAYAQLAVERAARFALRLHADCVDIEHMLAALLEDEDSAAGQIILHAFADPETILAEVIALCPGILVIGSKRSLPLSVLGVLAMQAARPIARKEGASQITPRHLLLAAAEQLGNEFEGTLAEIGFDPAAERPDPSSDPIPEEGALLKFFDADARRTLSSACHIAIRLNRSAISPVHLMQGALENATPGLAGLTPTRVQMAFLERDADESALPERRLPFSADLLTLMAGLPDAASTAPMLAWIVHNGNPELRALLDRQRVTPALLSHVGSAFSDPDPADV
jgi:hypothetical protein